MARSANTSAHSLPGSPRWPGTHRNQTPMLCLSAVSLSLVASTSACHEELSTPNHSPPRDKMSSLFRPRGGDESCNGKGSWCTRPTASGAECLLAPKKPCWPSSTTVGPQHQIGSVNDHRCKASNNDRPWPSRNKDCASIRLDMRLVGPQSKRDRVTPKIAALREISCQAASAPKHFPRQTTLHLTSCERAMALYVLSKDTRIKRVDTSAVW